MWRYERIPRSRSLRRRNSSTIVNKMIDTTTKSVATARMVGLISSRIPENIFQGIVRCSTEPTNSTTTTSSKDVMNASSAPDMTPGRMSGTITTKKVRVGLDPKLAAARVSEWSKPTNVAVTVMMTKGCPTPHGQE